MKLQHAVKPVSYLKSHTEEVIRSLTNHNVVITQDGEAKAVVMDIGTFDRWRQGLAML